MWVILSAAFLTWSASIVPATTRAAAPSPDDTYLDGLKGPWIMQGTFGNKAIRYEVVGTRALGGTWLQLRIVDAAKPPKYQAEVFLGYDAEAGDFVVHWPDTWGAAGARVVATGHRDGERLVVVFPYAAHTLRDTFQRDKAGDTWNVLVESQAKDGTWSPFGSFRLTRPTK